MALCLWCSKHQKSAFESLSMTHQLKNLYQTTQIWLHRKNHASCSWQGHRFGFRVYFLATQPTDYAQWCFLEFLLCPETSHCDDIGFSRLKEGLTNTKPPQIKKKNHNRKSHNWLIDYLSKAECCRCSPVLWYIHSWTLTVSSSAEM